MKRVLFLVYDMLPGTPVGSALRTAEFARRLPLVVDFRDAWSLDPEQVEMIPNGFSEEDFAAPVSIPETSPLEVIHCGRFQSVAGRSPGLLLRCVKQLRDEGRGISTRLQPANPDCKPRHVI